MQKTWLCPGTPGNFIVIFLLYLLETPHAVLLYCRFSHVIGSVVAWAEGQAVLKLISNTESFFCFENHSLPPKSSVAHQTLCIFHNGEDIKYSNFCITLEAVCQHILECGSPLNFCKVYILHSHMHVFWQAIQTICHFFLYYVQILWCFRLSF